MDVFVQKNQKGYFLTFSTDDKIQWAQIAIAMEACNKKYHEIILEKYDVSIYDHWSDYFKNKEEAKEAGELLKDMILANIVANELMKGR